MIVPCLGGKIQITSWVRQREECSLCLVAPVVHWSRSAVSTQTAAAAAAVRAKEPEVNQAQHTHRPLPRQSPLGFFLYSNYFILVRRQSSSFPRKTWVSTVLFPSKRDLSITSGEQVRKILRRQRETTFWIECKLFFRYNIDCFVKPLNGHPVILLFTTWERRFWYRCTKHF